VFGRIASMLGATELDDAAWDDIEALLIQSDMGVETTVSVIQSLRAQVRREGLTTHADLREALRNTLVGLCVAPPNANFDLTLPLNVILIVGVNGSGKTTSVAKLAQLFAADGWQVMLGAADTFRAAAIEQLQEWGNRLGVPVIVGQAGGDPGAVAYDAVQSALARKRNLLLVDTAGRLHTKFNLMEELKKVRNVLAKNAPGAPHEVWLVLDGTTGQNALAQAAQFKEAVGVTGVIVTKLDGTAKGGMVFAISNELGLPVRYVGVGESSEDLIPFEPARFVEALLDDNSD